MRILLAVFAAMAIAACQPEYARDSSEELGRWLRINDQYAIKRWNDRVLSRQSRFCVAAANIEVLDRGVILGSVASALGDHFEQAVVQDEPMSVVSARRSVSCLGTHYLAWVSIERIDCELESDPEAAAPAGEQSAACAGPGLDTLQMSWRIVDVHSGNVVNHLEIATRRAWTGLGSDQLADLLAEPTRRGAAALAGAP